MPVVAIDGKELNVSAAYGTERACQNCGTAFRVTNITGRQFYCSERCKERALWKIESLRPEVVAATRERCRLWATAHRNVTKRNPWLYGPPPFGEYLPGGAFSLRVTPAPRWPIELRNTRALHGMVTQLIDEPHDLKVPGFSLIPTNQAGSGWGVYVPNPEHALRLAGKQFQGVLFDREVVISCGPMHRLKAPKITKRGHRRLRVDVITPVVVRSDGGKTVRTLPTSGNLLSTLCAWLPRRVGVTLEPDAATLKILERHTQEQWTPMGDKYGTQGGFVGWMIVDTNAVGHWLLKVAELIGMGGKTAFGFGRIRVSDAE